MEKPEILAVVLGGGLKKDGKSGQGRTTNFQETGDEFGALGDRLRVVAASYLYKFQPHLLVVASGGKGQLRNIPGAVPVSEVIKKELIDLGVPADKIILESGSNNTYQQLLEVKKIVDNLRSIQTIIISNDYHLPRIEALMETGPGLNDWKKMSNIKIQSAEKILLENNPEEWQEVITRAYNSKAMKQRSAIEQRGIEDIKSGVYKFN